MNSDEIQSAIEFLLKSQANFEVQLEKVNQQSERTNQQSERTSQQLERTNQQLEETNQQLEETNQRISLLAETQTEFIQTVLRHVEDQRAINADMRQTTRDLSKAQEITKHELAELARAQQQTQMDISALTKIVGGLVKTVYQDGNPPPQA